MNRIFVVFKKQEGELTNAYSLVTPDLLKTIPADQIQAKQEVEGKLYTKEELEQLRDSLI